MRAGAAIAGWTATVLAGAAAALPAELAPHRAYYELVLAGESSHLIDAEGAFAVEWQAHCEGVAGRQRLWFVGRLPDGGAFDYDVRFTTFESADDRHMRFSMRSYQEGDLIEEFRGQARMPEDGGAGRATYTVPAGVEMRLPPNTLFPTRHVERLIERAEAGAPVDSFGLFDGAGVGSDALSFVTAAIGEPVPPAPDATGQSERAWPVALAYHPVAEGDGGTPLFELSFQLTADGVMRDVVLDYGAFALKARLDRLERLTSPECG